eukprot:3538958-Rhodomonas_salina.2
MRYPPLPAEPPSSSSSPSTRFCLPHSLIFASVSSKAREAAQPAVTPRWGALFLHHHSSLAPLSLILEPLSVVLHGNAQPKPYFSLPGPCSI